MMPLQLGEYRRHERALFSDYWIVIAWVGGLRQPWEEVSYCH